MNKKYSENIIPNEYHLFVDEFLYIKRSLYIYYPDVKYYEAVDAITNESYHRYLLNTKIFDKLPESLVELSFFLDNDFAVYEALKKMKSF